MTAPAPAALAALLLALPAAAADAPPPSYPNVTVKVNQVVNICATGAILCPALAPICDDNSVATIRDQGKGLELVGLKKGKTTCSVAAANYARQVFTVTVE